ncbi:hypothetical protein SKAU_G00298340 [Synaphobranchus kaupii]|uniref:Uncharacterized protein n=1 Tax=Synaphobranchus kaupii TaxID=118154 RepID=A0A9Q1IN18_SYNKA|nr:hypothetical protein SKAU_G00298340 [Synaphobranchus kaupii]
MFQGTAGARDGREIDRRSYIFSTPLTHAVVSTRASWHHTPGSGPESPGEEEDGSANEQREMDWEDDTNPAFGFTLGLMMSAERPRAECAGEL